LTDFRDARLRSRDGSVSSSALPAHFRSANESLAFPLLDGLKRARLQTRAWIGEKFPDSATRLFSAWLQHAISSIVIRLAFIPPVIFLRAGIS
jgi:hypothetical protein